MTAKSRKGYDKILCAPMEIYNTIYENFLQIQKSNLYIVMTLAITTNLLGIWKQ